MGEVFVSGAIKRRILWLETNALTQFIGAIPLNGMGTLDLPGLSSNNVDIVQIVIISVQNIDYEVWLFRDGNYDVVPTMNQNAFDDFIPLPIVTAGRRIAGAGFYYIADRLREPINYNDINLQRTLHMGLIPRTAPGKLAGALGQVQIKIAYRPIY